MNKLKNFSEVESTQPDLALKIPGFVYRMKKLVIKQMVIKQLFRGRL